MFAVLLGAILVAPFVSKAAETEPLPTTSSDAFYDFENLLMIELFLDEDEHFRT